MHPGMPLVVGHAIHNLSAHSKGNGEERGYMVIYGDRGLFESSLFMVNLPSKFVR